MSKQSFITILLSVLMSMTGAKSFALHDIEVKNSDGVTIYYVWTNNNTELAVSFRGYYCDDYSNEYSGNVVIPSSVVYNGNTYSVTSIGYYAFRECRGLTSVTIPNSVTSIGDYAFDYCSGLTSVTIPNSVTYIGGLVFKGCTSLSSVKVPVTDFSSFCQNKIISLIKDHIGKPVQLIDNEGKDITNFIVPNDVTSIGGYAFYGCSGLTSVTIPNSVTSIGQYAFRNCSGLTSVTIPNSVTSIGWNAFQNCSGLTSVTIPNSVTSIGNYAFSGCSGLTSVTIPNSVTSIGSEAFYGCTALISVTIPNSVTSIGDGAFSGCSGLATIVSEIKTPFAIGSIGSTSATLVVPAGTKAAYQSTAGWNSFTKTLEVGEGGVIGSIFEIDGIRYKIGENNTASLTYANKAISGAIVIPSQVDFNGKKYDVTSIGNSAFSDCSGLTSVTIPNSVTSIGYSAFWNCSGLTSVIIGSGVLSIGSSAFSNTNLKKTIWLTNTPPSGYSYASGTVNYVSNDQFNISNKVVYKYLSSYFDVGGIRYVPVSPSDRTCDAIDCIYDESAENINIGETVTNKGITLTVMKVNPYTCYQNKYIKDVKLSLGGDIGYYAFYECTGLNKATVNNLGGIGDNAFSGCSLLETAELGQNVTSIGGYAFNSCSQLKSIVIPDAVTSIGSYAFSDCSSMTSAKIGNGVETIDESAFSGCSALPSITIPQAVTTIGDYAFSGCTSLAKVTIADSKSTLTLGSNGSNPIFASCPLDYVYIGRDISYQTSSNSGYSPFYRNTSLREVKITDKETEISDNEFYGCTNLQTVTIGDGVNTIGNRAFSSCSSLKYFTFGSQLENIGQEAFSDCTALVQITSRAKRAPACGSQALEDINKWECKLNVPKGYLSVYQEADQWKDFFYTEEGEYIPPMKGDVNSDSKVNQDDLRDLVEYIMGNKPNGVTEESADVNGDKKVNIADVVALTPLLK